jgi:hypothetical protein
MVCAQYQREWRVYIPQSSTPLLTSMQLLSWFIVDGLRWAGTRDAYDDDVRRRPPSSLLAPLQPTSFTR